MIKNVTEASDGSKWTDNLGLSVPDNLFTINVSQAILDYLVANVSVRRVDPWSSTTSAMGTVCGVHRGRKSIYMVTMQDSFLGAETTRRDGTGMTGRLLDEGAV